MAEGRNKWVPVTTPSCPDAVGENPQMSRFAANILNNQSRRAHKGWSSTLGLGEVLTTPHRINLPFYATFHKTSDSNCSFGTT